MFERIIKDALDSAGIIESDFDAAIKAAKFKGRFDWFFRAAPLSLVEAYNARVKAENDQVREAIFGELPKPLTPCRHRDDGRGRCIDCGDFL